MAAKRKNTGLGKGLEALFADNGPMEAGRSGNDQNGSSASLEDVVSISIDRVKPNQSQPRKNFNEEALNDLADSIKEHGIIQPIIVRPSGKGYEIVAGERRYRAARIAGLKEIPCIVRELSDRENMLLAIVENMQREDLNPIEEAEGLNAMMDTYGLTQEEVSRSVGKSRPYIANSVRLLNLVPEVVEMVRAGEISAGHGRTLLGCSSDKKQLELARRAAKEGLSVRSLERMVSGKTARKKHRPRAKDPNVAAVENELQAVYGTKVNLIQKGTSGQKGAIEIEFYSAEERDRLIDMLRNN